MDSLYQKFIKDELHNVLRDHMKRAELKQTDLVKITGFTQTYISQILTGDKFPPLDTLCVICDCIGVPPHEVLYAAHIKASVTNKATIEHIAIKFLELKLYFKQFYNL